MRSTARTTRPRAHRAGKRRTGSLFVWCAFLLLVMLGMVGLTIDGGLMLADRRHGQNGADSGALAAAYDKVRGRTDAQAQATGVLFATDEDHSDLPDATATINIPPTEGPYAGAANYAEAIVHVPVSTYFIHVLGGVDENATVRAHAVAGFEMVAAGEGVIALNPDAWPGLQVRGDAQLVVHGDIYVNSEGGGLDENGDVIRTGRVAASVSNNATVRAENVNVVGGVNDPDNFENIVPGGDNPLDANTLGMPDPLINLPTPTVDNGVVDVRRGAPQASDGSLALNNTSDGSGSPNYIEVDATTGVETMILQPGIYDSIKISGGNVVMLPGIYVVSPQANDPWVVEITGGNVTAEGIMLYNTGSNYDPVTGLPDLQDGENPPAAGGNVRFGGISINASMQFSPIDSGEFDYGGADVSVFDGMLIYYRRWNDSDLKIEGNSSEGDLAGTLYAKWSDVQIAGQGTYDAQFIVGSMDISGQGDVTINYNGDDVGRAARVFLVD